MHIVAIVVACLEHPASLRALRSALMVMAPDDVGTRRACSLIESASLVSLLPELEIRRARDLMRRFAARADLVATWSDALSRVAPEVDVSALPLDGFDQLAAQAPLPGGYPPALALVGGLVAEIHGPLADDLSMWLVNQTELLDLPEINLAATQSGVEEAEMTSDEANPARDRTREQVAPVSIDSDKTDVLGELETGDAMGSVASARRAAKKLPQVWGDVPPRNPNFTGREALLATLQAELRVARETAVLPRALHGMGGVGKSQVAIEYVHRHSEEYELVWWIPAEQTGQILNSLAKLAQRLDLDVGPEANTAVPAVREALSTGKVPYENWLLVFDNAESLQEVRSYFPTGGAGKILVTSRNPEWAAVARALEVDVFTRDESKEFLTSRTPELTDGDADRLAAALGDLPLAVEQAAAWRAATGMSVDEYLRLLEEKRMELLDDTSSPDYQRSVAAAWNVSLDKLEEVNIAALQLLQVCSFFAPEPISREFFSGSPISPTTDALDETLRDPIKLGRAIREIQRYALAKFDHRNNTLQMHRLVQAVLVGRMDERHRDTMRRAAHTLLASANPHNPGHQARWERYVALLPHVLVSRIVESDDSKVQELVFEIVEFLYHWGDHDGCLAFAEEAYKYRLRLFGEDDHKSLRLAKYLGYVRFVVGQYASAAELLERSWNLYVERFGEQDEGTLDAMLLVALARRYSGDFMSSLDLDERAHGICHRLFGAEDPVTLRAAHNLAVSLRLNARFDEALQRDEKTFQRRRDVLGPDSSDTMNTLSNLTTDLRESGRYREARVRQEENHGRLVRLFGAENPWTLRAARSLAVARRRSGDHQGALQLSEEVIERFRRRYGEDYPDTLASALNLTVDLRHAGDLDRACDLGQETVSGYARLFGLDHPHTLAARVNLAVALRLRGDANSAYWSNKETFDALVGKLGADHAVTLTCATNLASDLFALDKTQDAYERDTDTLARSERMVGVEHPSTLAISVNLALDLRALGRAQEADLLHADTMTRFRRVLGDQHPATLNALKSVRADCDLEPIPL